MCICDQEQCKWKTKSKTRASDHKWSDLIWSDTDLHSTCAPENLGYCILVKASFLHKRVIQKKPNQQNPRMYPMASPWQRIDAHSAPYIHTGRRLALSSPTTELKAGQGLLQWKVLGFNVETAAHHSSRISRCQMKEPSQRVSGILELWLLSCSAPRQHVAGGCLVGPESHMKALHWALQGFLESCCYASVAELDKNRRQFGLMSYYTGCSFPAHAGWRASNPVEAVDAVTASQGHVGHQTSQHPRAVTASANLLSWLPFYPALP